MQDLVRETKSLTRDIDKTPAVGKPLRWLATALQDLRHGVVLLGRDAGVSALIVLVLALGIGGTTAVFTMLKAAFLDPLPYGNAERLVTIIEDNGGNPTVSEFLEIRRRSRALEQFAFAAHTDMQLIGADVPVRVFAAQVTASFFPLLEVNASLGRTFFEEENQPGRSPIVVLSDAFWRSSMGADPGAIGRTLRLDGEPAVVVGVLPPGFHFDYPTLRIPDSVDIYVPFSLQGSYPLSCCGGLRVRSLARLREGISHGQAESELHGIASALMRENPSAYRRAGDGLAMNFSSSAYRRAGDGLAMNFSSLNFSSFQTVPLRDAVVGRERYLLWLTFAGVVTLLLIACANAAQLLLARSLRRGREVAIRAALGAGRLRLIRQFLLEGLVLAVCGGVAGLLMSGPIVRVLVIVLPARSPLLDVAQLDARVTAFTLAVSVISAMAFAIVPAVKGSRWTPGVALGSRSATDEGNRWRHAMIALEAALSVFLLCGAGLVAENLWSLTSTPMGFDPNNVLAMQLKLAPQVQPARMSPEVVGEAARRANGIVQ